MRYLAGSPGARSDSGWHPKRVDQVAFLQEVREQGGFSERQRGCQRIDDVGGRKQNRIACDNALLRSFTMSVNDGVAAVAALLSKMFKREGFQIATSPDEGVDGRCGAQLIQGSDGLSTICQ